MAKSTRGPGKKEASGSRAAVIDMPNPNSDPEPAQESEEQNSQETPETASQETAESPGTPEQPERGKRPPFFIRLTHYDPARWEDELMLYVYRLAPITDRRASGEPQVHIAKLTQPIDEDYILRQKTWGGSGRYRVMLTRKQPGANKSTCIDSVETELLSQEYPPCVPPGEWVEDPRNKRWAWARKKDEQAAGPAAAQDRGLTVDDAFKIIGQAREWVQSAKDQSLSGSNIVDLIKQTQTANDPQKIIDAARAMLEIMKPGPPPDRDAEAERFVKFMALAKETFQPPAPPAAPDPMQQLKNMAETLKSLMPPPPPAPPPPPDPVAQIKAQAETIKALREVFGEGDESGPARRSNMTGWQEMLQPLFGQIGPVLTVIGQAVVHRLTAPAAGTAPASVATPAVAGVPVGTIPPASPNGDTAMSQEQIENQKLLSHIFGWLTPNLLHHLSNGLSGADFAGWVADGRTMYNGIPIPGLMVIEKAKEIGRDNLIALYKANPPIWAQLSNQEERFAHFIDEFLAWDPNATGDDEDDAPPPAAPTKSGRKAATQ